MSNYFVKPIMPSQNRMADERIDCTTDVLAAGEINDHYQDHCYNHDRPEPDHPEAVVIVIFEPDRQPDNHMSEQQDDGNGLEHYFKKGVPIPGNIYVLKFRAVIEQA